MKDARQQCLASSFLVLYGFEECRQRLLLLGSQLSHLGYQDVFRCRCRFRHIEEIPQGDSKGVADQFQFLHGNTLLILLHRAEETLREAAQVRQPVGGVIPFLSQLSNPFPYLHDSHSPSPCIISILAKVIFIVYIYGDICYLYSVIY